MWLSSRHKTHKVDFGLGENLMQPTFFFVSFIASAPLQEASLIGTGVHPGYWIATLP